MSQSKRTEQFQGKMATVMSKNKARYLELANQTIDKNGWDILGLFHDIEPDGVTQLFVLEQLFN